ESSNFNARKYQHPNYIFDLNIPSSTSLTYYLKVKSAEQIILPITINTPTTLWERLTKDSLITGIYTGIVLIMFLYNLFLFFSVKDKSYLFYVIYVAFVGLTQIGIKGYTFQYLWPELSEFQLKSTILFACVSGFAALLFTQNFLQ